METSKELTNDESLHIIKNMILAAKQDFEDDSFYYLFWGWLVFIASISHFVLLQTSFAHPYISWMLMPIGGIITAIYGSRQAKQKKVKTYMDHFLKFLVIAFVISLMIILFSMNKLGLSSYPMIMLTYATFLFVSGGAIESKPIMFGGIINWIGCIIAFFVTFEHQLLILALAVLFGYIIPGYMLKRQNTRNSNIII
jgi:hypothetical protein